MWAVGLNGGTRRGPAPDARMAGRAFRAVVRQQGDIRELEQAAAEASLAMLDGWIPPLGGLSAPEARRAGYWREVMAAWMFGADGAKLRAVGEGLRTRAQGASRGGTFYPAPRVLRPDGDPIAAKWGLVRGVRPLELRQAIARTRLGRDVMALDRSG